MFEIPRHYGKLLKAQWQKLETDDTTSSQERVETGMLMNCWWEYKRGPPLQKSLTVF